MEENQNQQAPAASPADALSSFGDPQQLKASAAALDANTVKVTPGGATFTTISAALASITDASMKKQYLVTAGPGTYNEQVVLKPYVYLHGAGPDVTVVTTAPVQQGNIFNRGTIVGAGNSGITALTASCLGGNWGDWSTALLLPACSSFMASEVVLLCDDKNNAGINIETVAVNWNTQPEDGPSVVYLSYAAVLATTQNGDSTGQAMIVNGQANLTGMESKFIATGNNGQGVASNGGATVTLDNCVAQGQGFALNIPDYHSTLIANNCTIDGPVQNGVQINNNPPPQ
jgi:hypothetical protein